MPMQRMNINTVKEDVRVDKNINSPASTLRVNTRRGQMGKQPTHRNDTVNNNTSTNIKHQQTTQRTNVKDKIDVEDKLFALLRENTIALEKLFGLHDKSSKGKLVKDLTFNELFLEMQSKVKTMTPLKRMEILSKSSTHLGILQLCCNHMKYYRVAKLKFGMLDGANEICNTIQVLFEQSPQVSIKNCLNIVCTGLSRNEIKGSKVKNIPSYRLFRLLCIYVIYKDMVSVSILANLLFGQAILEQEVGKKQDTRRVSNVQ